MTQYNIKITNPPTLPGLRFRHFRGDADYVPMAAILTASEKADHIEREVSAEDLADGYQHLTNCDPYKDLIMAEIDGEMVGFARGWWRDESTSGRLYGISGFLNPAWRRMGIGGAMQAWMEDRLREVAGEHPGSVKKFFQSNTSHFQEGAARMLERAGYTPESYFIEMVHTHFDNLPDRPLPSGLEVRPVTEAHYRAIWKSADETSQDEWGYNAPTENDYQEWLNHPHFQPHLWQIAWDTTTGQVAGHVLTFIDEDENEQFDRQRGYTEGIGVNRTWRGRGLAKALIALSLKAQKDAGMTESALTTYSDTPDVTRLYESLGFEIASRSTLHRKPLVVKRGRPVNVSVEVQEAVLEELEKEALNKMAPKVETNAQWATEWLDSIVNGLNKMSQRRLSTIEKHEGGLEAVKALAEARGLHLMIAEDNEGNEVVAASRKPFRVIC